MTTKIVETFQGGPAQVKAGIMQALTERFPDLVQLLEWNPEGTRATGSKYGAKGSLELAGAGPTTATLTFSIGFPASMKYSEEEAAIALRAAIKEMKSKVP